MIFDHKFIEISYALSTFSIFSSKFLLNSIISLFNQNFAFQSSPQNLFPALQHQTFSLYRNTLNVELYVQGFDFFLCFFLFLRHRVIIVWVRNYIRVVFIHFFASARRLQLSLYKSQYAVFIQVWCQRSQGHLTREVLRMFFWDAWKFLRR